MAAAIVQAQGGTSGATAPASYSVTLPNPTAAGNLVVIVVASDATVATPAGFTLDRSQVNSNGHYHWSKVTAGGETGWTVTPNSSAAGCWHAYEISGLTATPTDQVTSTGSSSGATTRSTGTTGTTTQAAELAVASWGSSTVGAAVTWGGQTNGFTENIPDQVTTTGGSNVAVSVAFATLSATGTVESTATADAGQAPKSTGIIVTYLVAGGSTIDAGASLAATAALSAAAATTQPAGAAATATAGLTAAATVDRAAAVTLAASAGITSTATLGAAAGSTLTAAAGVTAAATVDTSGAAGLAAAVSIIATADIPAASGVVAFAPEALYLAALDHALTSGLFDAVNGHEPKSAPGRGLTAALWADTIDPVPTTSGLALTTMRLGLNLRIYSNMLQEPQDAIDPNILTAVSTLMAAYSGDFTLGGLLQEQGVDLLGRAGPPLSARAGYLNQDNRIYRVMTILLPLIVPDCWEQAP
jgi:hypothetical protein